MSWEKIESRLWRAVGKNGMFFIEQKGKTFWGRYVSNSGCKNFNMRPKAKLSEAKAQCESNYYWEVEAI